MGDSRTEKHLDTVNLTECRSLSPASHFHSGSVSAPGSWVLKQCGVGRNTHLGAEEEELGAAPLRSPCKVMKPPGWAQTTEASLTAEGPDV